MVGHDPADWLADRVAEICGIPRDLVELDVPTATLGLSSIQMVELAAELEDRFGVRLEPTVMWDYPTIDALAEHLGAAA